MIVPFLSFFLSFYLSVPKVPDRGQGLIISLGLQSFEAVTYKPFSSK